MKSEYRILRFLKPYWHWVALAPLLMTVEVAMDVLQPRLVQRIVDEGIANLDLPLVLHTGLLMVCLAAIGAIGGIGNGIFASITVQSFGADLREALFRKTQSLSFANLDELETGSLITRLTNDVAQVQEAIHVLMRILIRAPLLMIGSLTMAVLTCPELAFLPLTLMPALAAVVIWILRKATPMYALVQERLDGVNETTRENLSGVRVVKAFVRGDREIRRFSQANNALMEQSVLVARAVARALPMMMLFMNAGVVGVLWFGGVGVSHGQMQVGQIIAFINYLMITLFSLMMVSMLVVQVARAKASAKRILEVFDSEPKVADRPGARREFEPHGRISFANVAFHYNGPASDHALREVSFEVAPGQTVALLGATGAGKSTLAHLIPRFYDATEGRVSIDGVDVRDIAQEELRRSIGIALQETVLFRGSIRDNIRYGRPEASQEEVAAAARAAQAHDFIMALPDGYDTLVGQRGVNLSGGQKQRIAIARALLVKPAVLILDDSTSAVDVETEARILDALAEETRSCARILIAQRISTVLHADTILVLDEGRIVAKGTHDELLASSPVYREIHESQLGNGGAMHG